MPTLPTPQPDSDQETEYRCTSCSRLLYLDELNRFACRPCEARGHKQITQLPTLYRHLSAALAPSSSQSNTGRVRSSKEAPLPVNLHVLAMLGPGGIVADLQAIEDSWRCARGRRPQPRHDGVRWFASSRVKAPAHAIKDHCLFIAYNLQWACEFYGEIAQDLAKIAELQQRAQGAIVGPRRRTVAVPCPSEYDDGTLCGAELRIDISVPVTRCRACGAEWGREHWVRWHDAIQAAA